MYRIAGALLLGSVLAASAATLHTSVLCELNDLSVQDANFCRLGPPGSTLPPGTGRTYAEARSGYDLTSYQFRANGLTDTYAETNYDYMDPVVTVRGLATASVSVWLTTEGPVRDGWVDLNISLSGDGLQTVPGKATASVGLYSASLGPYMEGGLRGTFPITLGQPFLVTLWTESQIPWRLPEYGFWFDGHSAVAEVDFRLYEQDGERPVAMFETTAIPEPAGTAVLGMAALAGLLAIRWKRTGALPSQDVKKTGRR